MWRTPTLQQQIDRLSKIGKALFIVLFFHAPCFPIRATTGFRLPGWTLVRAVFIIAAIVFMIRSFPRMVRSLLWRVRHRLLVTWILVGVVPIVLICALVGEGLFILMGQVVGYMTTTE